MNGFPLELLALAALFAVNRLVVRRFLLVAPGFWALIALDVFAAGYVYLFGVPGLEDGLPVRLLVGTVVVFHIATNFAARARAKDIAENTEERRRVRLKALRGAPVEVEGDPGP